MIFVCTLNRWIYIKFVGFKWAPMNIGGARVDFDRPHIFVGAAMSLTNIIHVYSSVTWPHRWIYGSRADGVWPVHIRWLTYEYRWAQFHITGSVWNRRNPLSYLFHTTAYIAACAHRRHTRPPCRSHQGTFSLIFLNFR
jgi:hypothetical protein